MGIDNHQRMTLAMDLLRQGLGPFVEREFRHAHGSEAVAEALRYVPGHQIAGKYR